MPKESCPKKLKRSFVLVELLVAVSIFAVVVSVVYATLYTGIKAYSRIQRELRLNQEVNQILDRLSAELRNCYDAEYNAEDDRGGFIGNNQNLSFFTIQNVYSNGGLKKLLSRPTYSFKDGALFKKIQLDGDIFLDEESFQEEELISDIGELSFEYLYSKSGYFPEEFEYEWKPEWLDKSLIPKGVKIKITRYDTQADISLSLERYILLLQGEVAVQ